MAHDALALPLMPPSGHALQARAPEAFEYIIGGHASQVACPSSAWANPGKHGWQGAVVVSLLKVPGAQGRHSWPPWPAAQKAHDVRLASGRKDGGHTLHWASPGMGATLVLLQAVQEVDPTPAVAYPGAQKMHGRLLPASGLNVPGWQSRHRAPPCPALHEGTDWDTPWSPVSPGDAPCPPPFSSWPWN